MTLSTGTLGAGLSRALLDYGRQHSGVRLHSDKAVDFTVVLNDTGEVVHILHHPKVKGEARYMPLCPREPKMRSSGSAPLLITDNPQYVLGHLPGMTDKDLPKVQKKHADYLNMLDTAAEVSHDAALIAQAVRRLTPDDFPIRPDKGETITFSVAGRHPHDDPALQEFWIAFSSGKAEQGLLHDAVTGEAATLTETGPAVKGVAGGKVSLSYQSTNASSSQRMGLKHLGVSQETLQDIVAGLNRLTSQPETATYPRGSNLTVLHWLSDESAGDPWLTLSAATPQLVHDAFEAFEAGRTPQRSDATIHLAVLKGAAARLLTLHYSELPLDEATRHLAAFTRRSGYLPMWQLINAAATPGKDNPQQGNFEVLTEYTAALYLHALLGQPLPRKLLLLLNQKWRSRLHYTRAEAALTRLTLGWKEDMNTQDIPEPQRNPYALGQYAAQAGHFHQRANPGVQVTVTDRLLRMLSTRPNSGYAQMSAALSKIELSFRRHKPFAARKELEQLTQYSAQLTLPLPQQFTPEQKAAFQLGYEQRRQELFKEAEARRAQFAQHTTQGEEQ